MFLAGTMLLFLHTNFADRIYAIPNFGIEVSVWNFNVARYNLTIWNTVFCVFYQVWYILCFQLILSLFFNNIWVVDDDTFYGDVLSKFLTNAKYKVKRFYSGMDVVDRLRNEPDLIFIDVQMDIMDGIQTTRILKKKWPSVKIVLISSNERAENTILLHSIFYDSFEPKSKDMSGMLKQLNHFKKRKVLLLFLKVIAISILAVVLYFFWLI